MSWQRAFLLTVICITPTLLPAQESPPVRARFLGDPIPGRDAPAFSLPYATADGAGPVDQPFVLRAELGRVVVLAFCAGTSDSAAANVLRGIVARDELANSEDVVLAGILATDVESLARFARETGLSIKVLGDATGRIRRLFGVGREETAVYVIDRRGRVVWRDTRFNPFLATGYERVGREVVAALSR